MRERCVKNSLGTVAFGGTIDVPAFFVNTMILLKTMVYDVGQCGTLSTLRIRTCVQSF